jgi:uncharacterized membrane protein YdjX (TVP38/TMEM64 family)
MALNHETIVSWTPRNIVTIAAMAILGFFVLHILSVNAAVVGSWLASLSAGYGQSGSIDVGGPQASYSYDVGLEG